MCIRDSYYVGSGPKSAKFLSKDEIDSDSTRYVHKATPEIQLKNIALLTLKKEADFSRPTPCYIKPADAAPSSNKVPNLLKCPPLKWQSCI